MLEQYYVQDVCSPSRATFMTGRFPLHNTVNDWLKSNAATGLPLNETTMAQYFKGSGYKTHAIGKWHLGFYTWAHTPTFRGFDSFLGFYSGGEDYFTHIAGGAYDMRSDASPECGAGCSKVLSSAQGRYSTTVFSEEAVRVVESHNASEPLFLYLAYQAVHAPSQVPDSYKEPYVGKITDSHRQTFAGMLSCMDEGLGNVTAALARRGLDKNLIIVFTTDNGGPVKDTPGGDYVGSSNYPLRGGKHSIWEGGTRGTAVLWASPDMLKTTGYKSGHLMHGADWLPTLCEGAGLDCSNATNLDGVSLWSALSTNASTSPREEFVYGRHDDAPEAWKPYDDAIRSGDWKLIQGTGGKPNDWSTNYTEITTVSTFKPRATGDVQLYNVVEDPEERHECAADNPDVVKSLTSKLNAARNTAIQGAPGDGNDPRTDCPAYAPGQDPVVGKVLQPWCNKA